MSFFVLAGLYIVGGCLLEVFGVGRTVYAVTSRRALILKCFMRRRVLAIMPSDMNALDWHENRDGSGSIIIRREVHEDFEGKSTTELGFVGTRDIRGAVREIEKLRAAKHSPESRAGFPEVPTSQD